MVFFYNFFRCFFLNTQSTFYLKPWHGFSSHYIQPITVEMLVIFVPCEDVSEENKENIEEINDDFISMKGNLRILRETLLENNFKWMNVPNRKLHKKHSD